MDEEIQLKKEEIERTVADFLTKALPQKDFGDVLARAEIIL